VKVELAKTFLLAVAPDAAWNLLQDVEAVASCMPGAKITERIDDTRYKGTVTVRVGPATLSFRGDIEVKEIDAATRTLRLVGRGSDTTGSSAGSMDLIARIDAADDGRAVLNGQSAVSLSGKAAAFGGRMVNAVADQILGQFAGNFATRLPASGAQSAGVASASAEAGSTNAAAAPAQPPAATSSATAASDASAPAAAGQPPAAELNGLSLLWAVIRDWLRGIFGGKRA
jgi:carbon monoxide dehydrogenase subunit G